MALVQVSADAGPEDAVSDVAENMSRSVDGLLANCARQNTQRVGVALANWQQADSPLPNIILSG